MKGDISTSGNPNPLSVLLHMKVQQLITLFCDLRRK